MSECLVIPVVGTFIPVPFLSVDLLVYGGCGWVGVTAWELLFSISVYAIGSVENLLGGLVRREWYVC